MDNFQRNMETIARGLGSEQARAHDRICDCPICNGDCNEREVENDEQD